MSRSKVGLGRAFAEAVLRGEMPEQFCTRDVFRFVAKNGWTYEESYINVLLANGSAPDHSLTYKKYFRALGDGLYTLSDLAKQELG